MKYQTKQCKKMILPVELIVKIMKESDIDTLSAFMLVCKSLSSEVLKILKPIVTLCGIFKETILTHGIYKKKLIFNISNKSRLHEVGYFKNDCFHREVGPAMTMWRENGRIKYEKWYKYGNLHREDGPSSTFYFKNQKIKSQSWHINGNKHNQNGPSYLEYAKDISMFYEYYDDIDIDDKHLYTRIELFREEWHINDQLHREGDLPACMYYDRNGRKIKLYCLNGNIYKKEVGKKGSFKLDSDSCEGLW